MTTTKATEPAEDDDWDRELAGWDDAETDIGEKIIWDEEPRFLGTYRGDITVKNPQLEDVLAHQLVDKDGVLRFAWGSPELTTGLRDAGIGAEVGIKWLGLFPGRRKGTTQNHFTVRYRRAGPRTRPMTAGEVEAAARKAYDETVAAARKAYDEVMAAAGNTCEEAVVAARNTCEEAMAAAGKAYKEAVVPARKAYKEAVMAAGKAYHEAVTAAGKAYDEAMAAARNTCEEAVAAAGKAPA